MTRRSWLARKYYCRTCERELWKGQCYNPRCPRYLRGSRLRFKAGTRVVVKRWPRAVRTVVGVYTDIDGGRWLDRPVGGFISWNVSEMRAAR